jgi:hypothetical protein
VASGDPCPPSGGDLLNRAEMELLELGLLHPVVIPELVRAPDGRLEVGCRYGCPCPPSADVADTIRVLLVHTEGLQP